MSAPGDCWWEADFINTYPHRPNPRAAEFQRRPYPFIAEARPSSTASQAPLVRLEERGGWECGRYKSHQMQLSGLPDAQTHDTHLRT